MAEQKRDDNERTKSVTRRKDENEMTLCLLLSGIDRFNRVPYGLLPPSPSLIIIVNIEHLLLLVSMSTVYSAIAAYWLVFLLRSLLSLLVLFSPSLLFLLLSSLIRDTLFKSGEKIQISSTRRRWWWRMMCCMRQTTSTTKNLIRSCLFTVDSLLCWFSSCSGLTYAWKKTQRCDSHTTIECISWLVSPIPHFSFRFFTVWYSIKRETTNRRQIIRYGLRCNRTQQTEINEILCDNEIDHSYWRVSANERCWWEHRHLTAKQTYCYLLLHHAIVCTWFTSSCCKSDSFQIAIWPLLGASYRPGRWICIVKGMAVVGWELRL